MSQSGVGFFLEGINFRIRSKKYIRSWISDSVINEGKIPGEISIIFCGDAFLLEMNMKYLNHDTLTDIITFEYNEGQLVSGDIFISIERVKENARLFSKSFNEELHRVIIHGVLHLCGYKDKTTKDTATMRQKEEEYLGLIQAFIASA